MSTLKVSSTKMLDSLSFLAPGFEKTGTHVEAQLLHIDLLDGGDDKYLTLSTRNRYVLARHAIKLPGDEVSVEEFTALIDYERFRNYLAILPEDTVVTLSVNDSILNVSAEGGKYKYSNEETPFITTQPELEDIGEIPYEAFYEITDKARLFTSSDRGSLSGNSIRLYHKDGSDKLIASVFRNSEAAEFSYPLNGEAADMAAFDVHLKASIFKKVNKRDGEVRLVTNEEQDTFGLIIPLGKMTMSTLNDVDTSAEFIEEALVQDRPYHFSIDRDDLEDIIAKMSLFASETVLVEVSNEKVIFKAKSSRGIDGVESVECEHSGELNLELPLKVMNNILRTDNSATSIKFNVDENGLSALVKGRVNDIDYKVLFSVQGDDDDAEA